MIVDTSAIVAIVKDEPERVPFLEVMNTAEALMMSTATALEVTLVLGPQRVDRALDLMREAGVKFVDFTTQHLLVAQHGHARYGRGSGSPAKLNYGDCMSYALAKVSGESLLFKGDDFTHTDIEAAWLPPDASSAT